MKKYYALEVKEDKKTADIYIFGDITSWEWLDSDVSSYTLSKEIQELGGDIETIDVHINSYGGEVAEGLAIYNTLRGHKAKIRTFCEGFACSIASVIFMAGDERIMRNAALLMIHPAWMYTAGNADQLRKDADDLDKITQASINAYMQNINISEDELQELLANETWILPSEALEMGFATSIVGETIVEKAAASAKKALFNLVQSTILEVPRDSGVVKVPEEGSFYTTLTATSGTIGGWSIDGSDIYSRPEPDPAQEPDPIQDEGPQENKIAKFMAALFR